jgi:stearoyl-CoA desaturase (delta-9 desaturase)
MATAPVVEEPHIATQAKAHPLSRSAQGSSFNTITLLFMIVFHAGAIAALFFFNWKAVAVAAVLYFVGINLGICLGYHRLLTHRGYKVPRLLKYFLVTCGTLTLEGGPLYWVVNHRVHHQLTDRHGDPHTPREGGWWSHAGWVIYGKGLSSQPELLRKYAPDILADRYLMLLSEYHWVPLMLLAVILFAAGGWPFVLWGIFFRVTLSLHATWLVNSATHMWGSRRFSTHDDSRNLWWVALLTGGEGWHNNHHAYPVSARHGLAWYEYDLNYYCIWLLGKLGLAKQIHTETLPQRGVKLPGE